MSLITRGVSLVLATFALLAISPFATADSYDESDTELELARDEMESTVREPASDIHSKSDETLEDLVNIILDEN